MLPEVQKDHMPVKKTIKKLMKNPRIMLKKNIGLEGPEMLKKKIEKRIIGSPLVKKKKVILPVSLER